MKVIGIDLSGPPNVAEPCMTVFEAHGDVLHYMEAGHFLLLFPPQGPPDPPQVRVQKGLKKQPPRRIHYEITAIWKHRHARQRNRSRPPALVTRNSTPAAIYTQCSESENLSEHCFI